MITPLFTENPSPIWIVDRESLQILEVNSSAVKSYGYSREEFLSKRIVDLQPREQLVSIFGERIATIEQFDQIGTIDHRDKWNNIFSVEIFCYPMDYKGTKACLVKGVLLDSELDEIRLIDKTEEELKYHLANSPLAYFIWDEAFRLQKFSPKITEWLGFTDDDLLDESSTGLAFEHVIHSDFLMVKQKIDALFSGSEENNQMEFGVQTKNGETKYLKLYNSALSNEDGELVSVLSLVENQTELVENEQTRIRQHDIIKNTSDFVALIDVGGNITYLNSAGRQLLQLPDEADTKDTSIKNYVTDISYRYLEDMVFPQAAKHGSWEGELVFQTQRGKEIPISAVVIAHRDSDGNVEYYSTISRDISNEKEVLNQLKAEGEKLELAMQGGDVGFWQYFPQKGKLDIDHSWITDKLGYEEFPIKDITAWQDIVHPDDITPVVNSFQKVIEGNEEMLKAELRLQKADGSYMWLLSKAKVVDYDWKGRPVKLSGIHLDIDDRKKNEQQLKRERDLQYLISDITRVINNNVDVEFALEECLRKICDYLQWSFGHIYVFDNTENILNSTNIWYSEDSEKLGSFIEKTLETTFEAGEGLVGKVFEKNKPVWIDRVQTAEDYKRTSIAEGLVHSVIAIPIQTYGEPSAIIEFYSKQIKEREDEIFEHLQVVVRQLGHLLERRKTLAELEERERKYRYIAENATDKISIYDADLNCIYTSPSTEDLLGYSPEEFTGIDLFDLVHPEDEAKVRKQFERLKAGEEIDRISLRFRHKKGHYVWVEKHLKPFYDEEGDFREVHVSTRNISARKRYEEKLEREGAFIDKALDSLPGLFYVLDSDYNYIRINQGFTDELGYTLNDLQDMHPLDFYYEKDHERISLAIQRAFTEGKANTIAKVKKRDGSDAWYYLTGAHFKQNGEDFILGTGIDISKQIHAEELLERKNELLSKLFDNSPVGIAKLDSKDEILGINTSFEEMFGFSKQEAMGKIIYNLIAAETHQKRQEEIFQDQLKGDDSFQYESVRLKKDGTEVPVLIGLVPIITSQNSTITYVIYVDITERKQYLDEIKKSLEEKRVLLQEIHHRVKNNLAVVSSFLQLQKFNTEDEHLARILTDSEVRVQTMALIHEKLYQSRSLSHIKMADYIHELISFIKEVQDPDENIKLTVSSDDTELNVNQAIPCALIINELVSNAYEHAFRGGEENKIEIHMTESGGMIKLILQDNGVGLPSDFDLNESQSLGYTIVNTLIKQLDADIKLENNKGTKITLSFERSEAGGSSSLMKD